PEPAPEPEPAEIEPVPVPEPPRAVARPIAKPTPPELPKPEPEPAEIVQAAPKPPATPIRKPPPSEPEPLPEPEIVEAEPVEEPPEDEFSAMLRSVETLNKRVKADERREGEGMAESEKAVARDNDAPVIASLTASEIGAIKQQIERCWNVPIGVRGIETMQVTLRIRMTVEGEVTSVDIEDRSRLAADSGFRIVAESAQRAVLSCRLSLPPEKYELWRDMVMTFHPRDAISG
ncbi:MAG: hypothetical protein KDH19_12865, partial [Geminicoccaceae bacterium]|nr:hypothetical protein [Geminicoccaceae bacterium]